MLYSAADVVSSGSWFIGFKALTLKGYTEARVSTLAKRSSCLLAWRAMRFGRAVSTKVMVIFRSLFFFSSIDTTLKMSSSSFVTELFEPSHWVMRLFLRASREALLTPFWIHPPYFTSTMLHPIVSIAIWLIGS